MGCFCRWRGGLIYPSPASTRHPLLLMQYSRVSLRSLSTSSRCLGLLASDGEERLLIWLAFLPLLRADRLAAKAGEEDRRALGSAGRRLAAWLSQRQRTKGGARRSRDVFTLAVPEGLWLQDFLLRRAVSAPLSLLPSRVVSLEGGSCGLCSPPRGPARCRSLAAIRLARCAAARCAVCFENAGSQVQCCRCSCSDSSSSCWHLARRWSTVRGGGSEDARTV